MESSNNFIEAGHFLKRDADAEPQEDLPFAL